ncbi:hypothetical protein ABH991_007065 [Bradyrhizobium ottawaense]
MLGELPRKRLDHIEDRGDAALVARERRTLGERVRNKQQPVVGELCEADRPARLDRFSAFILAELCLRNLFLIRAELADNPRLQAVDQHFLLGREQPDQHHDAVTKDHGEAGMDTEGGGRRRDQRADLETGGVDAIAQHQRADPQGRRSLRLRRCRGRANNELIGVHRKPPPPPKSHMSRSNLSCRAPRPCRSQLPARRAMSP